MPSPKAIEALATVAAKGVETASEKLFADTFSKTAGRAGSAMAETGAKPGYEALTRHIRASLLGKEASSARASAPGTVERQLEKALSKNQGVRHLDAKQGTRFVDDEIVKTRLSHVQVVGGAKPEAKTIAEATTARVEEKASAAANLEKKASAATNIEKTAAKPATPAINIERDPVMPTKAFEMATDRRNVSKLQDGSIVTEYLGAPLPFRFPHGKGEIGSYGHYAAYVKQLPDKSVTIGNPEGIDKIGRAFEKAHNTLGLQQPNLAFESVPKWLQNRHGQLAETGVPAWFRGDSTWLYGQANAAKTARPIEANFNRTGLSQLKFDSPTKMSYGPFEGLVGDAVGMTAKGEAVLVNTTKLVGSKPEMFIYKPGSADIQTWRSIATAGGESEIKQVLLTPKSFLLR